MFQDYLNLAFKNFKERKLRVFLTVLGIFIGIAAVVSLMSLGQGLQEAIQEQFELLGVDTILIAPSGGYYGMGVEGTKLTTNDIDVIKKVKGVDKIMGMIVFLGRMKFADESKYTWIIGIPVDQDSEDLIKSMGVDMVDGRFLKDSDGQKVLIGYLIAEGKFYEKAVVVRDKLEIEEQDFKVVGTLSQIGNSQDDTSVWIPIDTARDLFGEPERVDSIMLRVHPGYDVSAVAEDIKDDLRDYRDVDEGEEDFIVETAEDMLETFATVFLIVQIVVVGLAAISLLVGGIGIANTMYTSVIERTREIGIMKAVGARNSDIMLIFLIESGLLGLVGGIIGVLVGLGISKSIEMGAAIGGYAILKASLNPILIFGSLAFSFVVGSLSGLMPARQAASLKPVEALRYE